MSSSSQRSSDDRTPGSPGPLELCSVYVDGDLNGAQLAEFTKTLAENDSVRLFEQDCRWLGDRLRAMPANETGSAIVNFLRQRSELDDSRQTTVTASGTAQSGHLRSGSPWSRRAAVLMTLAAMLLLLVSYRLNGPVAAPESESRVAQLDTLTDASVGDVPAEGLETSQAFGGAGTSSDLPPGKAEYAARVLSQGDDWQILVVQVTSADREEVVHQIEQVAMSSGLRMESLDDADADSEDRMGVVLTSGRPEANAFVENVTHSVMTRSSEWNPAEVARMDRQTLIAIVRESMLTPTKSELHFGEVFLAVPQLREVQIAAADREFGMANSNAAGTGLESQSRVAAPVKSVVAGDDGAEAALVRGAKSRRASEGLEGAVAATEALSASKPGDSSQMAQGGGRPIFVVFEFGSKPQTDTPCL